MLSSTWVRTLCAVLMISLLPLATTGCVRMVATLSEEPVDQNHGKRTTGSRVEDRNIVRKTRINLYRADERFRQAPMKVVSFNGNVLLVGQVHDAQMKARASDIAGRIRHVRNVHNELQVGEERRFWARTNDTWITTRAKSRMLIDGDAQGRRTRVVTANGVVYLMGLLTRAEADAAVEQAQKVYGVQKIVKIIEYID